MSPMGMLLSPKQPPHGSTASELFANTPSAGLLPSTPLPEPILEAPQHRRRVLKKIMSQRVAEEAPQVLYQGAKLLWQESESP